MKDKHPSGRPVREKESRAWAYGSGYGEGFRLPHLRRVHRQDGQSFTHAVGFTAEFPDDADEIGTWVRGRK